MSGFGFKEKKDQLDKSDLNEGQKNRIKALLELFNLLAIAYAPTPLTAKHICKKNPPHFLNNQGQKTEDQKQAVGVRAYYGPNVRERHIAIDILKATKTSSAQISVSGFKYKCEVVKDDRSESEMTPEEIQNRNLSDSTFNMAVSERSYAAIQMVEQAKSMGWSKVDFAGTADPIERYILSLACQQAGLEHTETIDMPKTGTDGYDVFENIKAQFDKRAKRMNETILMPKNENGTDPKNTPTNVKEGDPIADLGAMIDQLGQTKPAPAPAQVPA